MDDLSEFHDVFFDEATEHLDGMESLLLSIDVNAPDTEQLNPIFRAAHSIKGGAAMFGFQDITELTHEMETVFDRVRKGQMPLSKDLVDVFLISGDLLRAMLAVRKDDGDEVPQEDVTALCVRLRLFLEPEAVADEISVTVAAHQVKVSSSDAVQAASAAPPPSSLAKGKSSAAVPEATVKRRKTKKGVEKSLSAVAAEISTIAPADQVKVSGNEAVPSSLTSPSAVEEKNDFGLFVDPATLPANLPEAAAMRPGDIKIDELKGVTKAEATHSATDASSIRVSVQKVDQLINLVGELVITQAILAEAASRADPKLYQALSQLERNTRDLQESAMSIRMLPMSFVFGRFPRVVRDLADKLNKQVELKTEGEGTELDKGLIERIVDPLTHLVRNSLDHGIELPAVRQAAGKPAKGTITLRAFHRGGNVMVEVSDDGAGLNRERLLSRARERGASVSDSMSDQEVFQLIFEAGFSTAEKITDVSGRGVGMDVVRRNIREMGGNVEISSNLGAGTCISIRLPLTLAILDGMSVAVGKEVFIIPLTYIIESLRPTAADVKAVSGKGKVVRVRGEYLPLISLHEVFNLRPDAPEVHEGMVVILESEGRKTAMFVDALVGQHQVVIKSLERNFRRAQSVSGATIMGDGRVALILDVAELVGTTAGATAK
ncbi:CheA signal transduction histidine kinase [Nitrosospira sp. Nl5]|uniref:chemotaxis protein CheW n=1 Tax=Nitrosospira sp. Nl5 TaxID=200120 RepID=UPI000880925B|nr:chemotaxis protein CheW [Nitrosospira sp. Nl5]SCY07197.1 CheA signal transduction histidine kinase [Nitrosospira sp. Nl5]